jgi:hypothetical protein
MLNKLRVDFDKHKRSFAKKPRLTHMDCGLIHLKYRNLFVKAAL